MDAHTASVGTTAENHGFKSPCSAPSVCKLIIIQRGEAESDSDVIEAR